MWHKLLAALGLKGHHHDQLMTSADYEFMKYVTTHGKHYETRAEYDMRAGIFKEALKEIEPHNADSTQTHQLGLNHLSDFTKAEYRKMLGYKPHLKPKSKGEPKLLSVENLAADVDWRDKGAVTGVKNQGQCGSCWAFSTTGSIEGAREIAGSGLTSLSEENLVECSKKNHGCGGGAMVLGFQYAEENPLMTEAAYPYTSGKGKSGSCKYKKSEGVGKVRGFEEVSKSASQMKSAISKGPVSVAVEADKSIFQHYRSGVITR